MPTIRGRWTKESAWPSARNYSRAYLHHLVRSGETLGAMLLSEINIAYYQRLMQDISGRDSRGTFAEFRERTRADWARAISRALRRRHAASIGAARSVTG